MSKENRCFWEINGGCQFNIGKLGSDVEIALPRAYNPRGEAQPGGFKHADSGEFPKNQLVNYNACGLT